MWVIIFLVLLIACAVYNTWRNAPDSPTGSASWDAPPPQVVEVKPGVYDVRYFGGERARVGTVDGVTYVWRINHANEPCSRPSYTGTKQGAEEYVRKIGS